MVDALVECGVGPHHTLCYYESKSVKKLKTSSVLKAADDAYPCLSRPRCSLPPHPLSAHICFEALLFTSDLCFLLSFLRLFLLACLFPVIGARPTGSAGGSWLGCRLSARTNSPSSSLRAHLI